MTRVPITFALLVLASCGEEPTAPSPTLTPIRLGGGDPFLEPAKPREETTRPASRGANPRGRPLDTLTEELAEKSEHELQEQRVEANEKAAVATMQNIAAGQEQVRTSGVIDNDRNDQGEFGFFGELSGKIEARWAEGREGRKAVFVSPPVLPAAFKEVRGGRVIRSGYVFQIYLPGANAEPLAERDHGMRGVGVDAAQAERFWCCYAWPITYGTTGRRAFFVNQQGQVLASTNEKTRYDGPGRFPHPLAVFKEETKGLDGEVVPGEPGTDGEKWEKIEQ